VLDGRALVLDGVEQPLGCRALVTDGKVPVLGNEALLLVCMAQGRDDRVQVHKRALDDRPEVGVVGDSGQVCRT